MNLESLIASRTSRSDEGASPSVMMRVAMAAVALGITVMIVTLAVIFGFKSQITQQLTASSGHVVVMNVRGVAAAMSQPIIRGKAVEEIIVGEAKGSRDVERYAPYALAGGVVRGRGTAEGVMVKGVDSLVDKSHLESILTDGKVPDFGRSQGSRDILMSSDLAEAIGAQIGERLELLYTDSEGGIERFLFRVSGLFSAPQGSIERGYIIGDIRAVQRLHGWASDQISGYEVWLRNANKASEVTAQINQAIVYSDNDDLERVGVFSCEELYPAVFDWLKTHDVNAAVVIIVMLLVAIFNMVTALLILVLERANMVGVLKSLGMNNRSLQRIFVYRALYITLRGVVIGNVVGLSLCFVQWRWQLVTLDASGYILTHVPISLSVGWVVMINVVVIAVITLAMALPSHMVTKIKPSESVKYR